MPSPTFSLLPVADAEKISSDRCTAYFWHPAPGVMVSRVEGYFSDEAALFIDENVRRHAAADRSVLALHDWWDATDYSTASRIRLTNMGMDVRPITKGVHILVRSRLLALGVQTANIVLRNMTVYSERPSFERFVRDAIDPAPRSVERA